MITAFFCPLPPKGDSKIPKLKVPFWACLPAVLYFIISVTKILVFLIDFNPLSFSPKGERFLAPSPLGEGREGGKIPTKRAVPPILRSVTIIVKNYTAGRDLGADFRGKLNLNLKVTKLVE